MTQILILYYSQGGRVRDLVKLGKHGISTLDKSMKGGKDHSFDNPQKGETVFYGRDRGEKSNMTSKYKSIDDFGEIFAKSSCADFGYVYDMKERKWYYFDYHGRKKEL